MGVTPEIHLKYTSRIWNIYNSDDKFLLLELRDESTMSTTYDLYNIKEKEYQWKGLEPGEQWKIGVSHLSERFLVMHEFDNDPLPKIGKLVIRDTIDGNVINEIYGLQPHAFLNQSMKCADPEGNIKYINLLTGKEEDDNFIKEDVMNKVHLPLRYTEGSDNFTIVKKFVSQYMADEAIGMAEYLEYADQIFLSFHVKETNLFTNWLVIVNSEGEVWLKEKIAIGEKLFSDSFFIWKDYLVFIVGQHELKAIKL